MSTTTITLATGQKMPMIGLGTWKSSPGQVKVAVSHALAVGYRHIDCAFAYGNEQEVGEALQKTVGPQKVLSREDVYIVSKLWNTCHHPDDVELACRRSLANLQLQYLDLYLMHWPMAFQRGEELMPRNTDGSMRYDLTHYTDTWKAMEQLVDKGLVRAIGLSNFNARQVDEILATATHKPAVNQVECHPYLTQDELLQHCHQQGIAVTAYSPLGSADRPWAKPREPKLLEDPRILALAQKYGKTPAQVILRWQLQRGVTCIPKSSTASRIKENLEVFEFSLSDEDMKTIASFNRGQRLIVPLMEKDGKQVWRDAGHPHFPFHDPY
uniref:alcohol dehydrogenase (NADP(+)) n=1 Tax=Geotrypetes seraphini TaxID=260995 RepID=A0A6P8R0R4_GEOSA|nr:aldo-keto reductase family 1 member A1-A-like isoform X1 [Geotrypetes seraphini]XP_033792276.1 aldo-keto reductase family 1 member A1-A-like isoform X1 [Geotrypetes seraphini]